MSEQVIRALLIEDDPEDALIVRNLARRIESMRVELDWVETVAAGREALARGEHDIYLVDYRLDGDDGLTLLREALAAGCRAPIIVLTGVDSPALDLASLRAGAADYLPKGRIDVGTLEHALRYALERRRFHQEAEDALQVRDEILAIVSHDLRNFLNVVLGAATIMEARALPADQMLKRVGVIRRAAEQASRLIADLLDVVMLETGRLSIDPAPEDLSLVAAEACEMFQPQALEKSLHFVCEAAESLPPAWVDRGRAFQVLTNVIGNACKFTPPGGSVTVRTGLMDADLCVTVTDSGPGIAVGDLPHLFEPFWQARRSARGGAGLGLAISKGIVEAHGGRISVRSTPGGGAEFSITVPAYTGSDARAVIAAGDPAARELSSVPRRGE